MLPSLSVLSSVVPLFSGHQTFVLRSTWLKKSYDIVQQHPDLFSRSDAYVLLGVGKNMAESIRYWSRVCGMLVPSPEGWQPSPQAHLLLGEEGWDRFLTSPTSWWWLHWQIASGVRRERPITWFYTFGILRHVEFTIEQLGAELQHTASVQGWKSPSKETIQRDIDCMVRCYLRPSEHVLEAVIEDALLCPFSELRLIEQLPGQQIYRLMLGDPTTLPDGLIAYAILAQLQSHGERRTTLTFNELAYMPGSPGRIFRLDEDALLGRLQRLDIITNGAARYNDSAGVRQVTWSGRRDEEMATMLLAAAYGRGEVERG